MLLSQVNFVKKKLKFKKKITEVTNIQENGAHPPYKQHVPYAFPCSHCPSTALYLEASLDPS